MGVMDFLSLLGGLALFLYGIQVMSEGMEDLAGGRLRKRLEKWTGSTWRAIAAGTIVTAAVQSSSAVTVAVTGLAGSGALGMRQAMGIIMGANVGTTLTAWIFAGNHLGNAAFAPVLAMAGVAVLLFSRKEKKRRAARGIVGFAILIFGMNAMEEAAAPLAHSAFFAELLADLENPVRGVLGGCVMTAAIQSSSASIGILQALCENSAVTYGAAIPVILGQNIGTCVTALLASVGMTREAKKAALLNFYFNLIGTAGFLAAFRIVERTCHPQILAAGAGSAGIAVIHSGFNILSVLVLCPFSGGIIRLAELTAGGWRRSPKKSFPL